MLINNRFLIQNNNHIKLASKRQSTVIYTKDTKIDSMSFKGSADPLTIQHIVQYLLLDITGVFIAIRLAENKAGKIRQSLLNIIKRKNNDVFSTCMNTGRTLISHVDAFMNSVKSSKIESKSIILRELKKIRTNLVKLYKTKLNEKLNPDNTLSLEFNNTNVSSFLETFEKLKTNCEFLFINDLISRCAHRDLEINEFFHTPIKRELERIIHNISNKVLPLAPETSHVSDLSKGSDSASNIIEMPKSA